MFESIKKLLDVLHEEYKTGYIVNEEDLLKFVVAAQEEYDQEIARSEKQNDCSLCAEICKVAVDSYSTENEHLKNKFEISNNEVIRLSGLLRVANNEQSRTASELRDAKIEIERLNKWNECFNSEMQGKDDAIAGLEHMLKYPEFNKLEREYFVDQGMEETIEKLEKENASLRDQVEHSVREESHKLLQKASQGLTLYILDLEGKIIDLRKKLEESKNSSIVDDASIISEPEKKIREEHKKIEPGMEIVQSSWIKVWYAAYDVLPVLSSQRKTISELEQHLKTINLKKDHLEREINRIRTCPVSKEVEEVFVRMRSDLVDWEPEIKAIRSAIENFQKAVDSYRNEIPPTINLLRTAKALRDDYADHDGAFWSELDEGIADAEEAFKEKKSPDPINAWIQDTGKSLDSQIAHDRGLEIEDLKRELENAKKQEESLIAAKNKSNDHLAIAAKQIDNEASRANSMHEEIERLLKEISELKKNLSDGETWRNALLEKDSKICRDIQKQDQLLKQIQDMISCHRF